MANRNKRDASSAAGSPMSEPEMPELAKLRAFDRQQHIQKALEMGMSREEAERHADDDLKSRDDASH